MPSCGLPSPQVTQRPEVKFIPTLLEEFLATLDVVLGQQQQGDAMEEGEWASCSVQYASRPCVLQCKAVVLCTVS